MKAQFNKMKARWEELKTREKQAVLIGGGFLVFLIFYLGIWKPAMDHLQGLRERIVNQQKTLLWMQAADKILKKSGNPSIVKSKPVSLAVFLSQMQKRVRQTGLESFLVQLKQSDKDSIVMQFQKVEFDRFMTMLMTVMKEDPVAVTRLSVLASDAPGYVNADVVLSQRRVA